MNQEIKLQKFDGPLDLLLQLIEQEEMNINDVALSKVTEQFLNYLDKIPTRGGSVLGGEEDRSEALADFLVIATRLVYLKSRNLLPSLHAEDDEGASLADQLKMYKQYVEASIKIAERWNAQQIAYGRVEPPVKSEGFVLPGGAKINDLYASINLLLNRLKPINPLPRITMDRGVSVKQRLVEIHNLLKKVNQTSFKEILSDAHNRTEVIVSFLAVLELVKQNFILVKQPKSFEDLVIIKA